MVNEQRNWAQIIQAAGASPLGIIALVLLVLEAGFVTTLVHAEPSDHFRYFVVMSIILGIVIIAVVVVMLNGAERDRPKPGRGWTLEGKKELETEAKKELLERHRPLVKDAERPRLTPDDQRQQLRALKSVIHQAYRYSTPMYFLDPHLAVIHWNLAFEIIFRPILPRIRRRHVNFFIAELLNCEQVFDHARSFTEEVYRGKLPLIDCEPLVYQSHEYGKVEFQKVAAQLTDDQGDLKAWGVALLIQNIDWATYFRELGERAEKDKLWSIYAISYDAVLTDYRPYRSLIQEVIGAIPPTATRVLELGAGTGNTTRALLDQGYRVTAVENNISMLEQLTAKGLQGVNFIIESVDSSEFAGESNFDAAVAVNVAYALEDPAGCFRRVADALKPGGIFSLSTTYTGVNLNPLLEDIEKSLREAGTFEAKEEHYRRLEAVNKNIQYSIAGRYSREEYKAWLELAGFEVIYNQLSYKNAVLVMHARKN